MNNECKNLGKIISIEEVINHNNYDGYKVTTNKTTIYVLINNIQDCCENWGYLHTEDDINDFIDAEIKEIKLTDTALKTTEILDYYQKYIDCGDILFITFETSKGTFQLVLYNAHNGFYGHPIAIYIDDKIIFNNII